MNVMDECECYYSIIVGSILQIVGAKGYCDACRPHSWEKTCIGVRQNATGAQYQNPLTMSPAAAETALAFATHHHCAFSLRTRALLALAEEVTGAANDHLDRPGDVEVSDAATHHVLGVFFSHSRVRTKVPDSQPENVHLRLSSARFLEERSAQPSVSSKPYVRA